VLVPVVFALTRWAWALGVPLGVSEGFFREGQAIALVSVILTAAGLMFVREALAGTFTIGDTVGTFDENWAVLGPELL
jgi:hypothetical protein